MPDGLSGDCGSPAALNAYRAAVRGPAAQMSATAGGRLRHTSAMSLLDLRSPQQRALGHVASQSAGPALDQALRVTLNFHPDRRHADGRPVLDALAEDGVSLSQFATGAGNGGLATHPRGGRRRWESRLFAGAYDA